MSSRPGSIRRLVGEVMLATFFALTPTEIPQWRANPEHRPVAVLPIGEPVPWLAERSARRRGR